MLNTTLQNTSLRKNISNITSHINNNIVIPLGIILNGKDENHVSILITIMNIHRYISNVIISKLF